MGKFNLYWRVDEQIRAPEVRVIGSDAKLVGVMATNEAIKLAREAGLMLIEIAPLAKPPVAKIADYGKFRYQEEKKARAQAKKVKGGEVKEIRFSPFIAENDYNTRLSRVREFLAEKNKVKLVVVFTKRQLGSKPFGYKVLGRINQELKDSISVDMQPKFLGKHLIMVISPLGKRKAVVKEEKNEIKEEQIKA